MHPHGTCDTGDDAGSHATARTHAAPGRPGRGRLRSRPARAATVLLAAVAALLALPLQAQAQATGICGRTEQVRTGILGKISGVSNCANVTDAQLAAITSLDLANYGITALAAGDFDGLTSLTTYLQLWGNSLSTLPAGVFDELTSLRDLYLNENDLSTLPAGVFDGLTSLTTLRLNENDLSTLPAGVFDELTALRWLYLHENDLSTLPAGVFDQLTALTELRLDNNTLSTLPAGVFDELTVLWILQLQGNPGAPFSPTANALPDDGTVSFAGGDVTLDGSGSDGGPWGTNVTYSWAASGAAVTFDDAASATPVVTIPALADDTELTFTLTVTGLATSTFRGSAPDTDTATVTAEFDPTAGICGRTEEVRTAIVARISGVTHCALVTDTQLAAITGTLDLRLDGITALAAGDFDGLTALTELSLQHNSLSTLPVGVFDELTSLTTLNLFTNSLSTLPAGVFDGLTALTGLYLYDNSLSTLPAGVFDGLTALTTLRLRDNSLSTLPVGVFDELTALTGLYLYDNSLSTLPAGVFDELTALTRLALNDNSLSTLPAGVFEDLTALTQLFLNNNSLPTLPAGVFEDLTALTLLQLSGNSLSTLPAGVFDKLTALTGLALNGNSLSTLPAGVFDKLTALTDLWLHDNPPGAPFSPTADALPDDGEVVVGPGGTVTLDGSGSDGGPWGTNVTYSWAASGAAVTFDDAASATPVVTIPALADGTELTFTLTVTGRATNTSRGSAPATDTATVTAVVDPTAGICGRTEAVRDAIVARISGVASCADVTDAQLAAITGTLDLRSDGITTLAAGDFDGLTALTTLRLRGNSLSTLPAGVFDELTALTTLRLDGNLGAPFSPTADALPDDGEVSFAGGDVTLDGSGSDGGPWGTNVTYSWAASGATVTFDDAASATPVVTIPALADGTELTFTLTVTGRATDSAHGSAPATDTATVTAAFDATAGICGRTEEVRTAILARISGVTHCALVTDAHLAAITGTLNLHSKGITALAAGDFDGLTALTRLWLYNNSLSTLPAGVFDDLTSLTWLWLHNNSLSTLPAGVFEDLTALTLLLLSGNSLSTLPAGVFDELTALTGLYLHDNGLTTLPAGVFEDLTALTDMWLHDNPGAPFSPTADALPDDGEVVVGPGGTVTLDGSGSDGGPWGTNVTYSWAASGAAVTFDDAASATPVVTIPALADGTELTFTLTVTGRATNTSRGSAPATDTATVTAVVDPTAGICGRTEAVRDAIVARISGVASCADVTDAQLAAITGTLDLRSDGITTLAAGDFDGLTALTTLRLRGNSLSTLPAGVFDELTALTTLDLRNNSLSTLPAGVFDKLTALTTLRLEGNLGAPFSPEADALPDDGTVPVAGGDVTLDGSGSGGPWGTNVTYSWALTSPTSGVTVTFDDAASATPVVTIPALADGTELTFTLTVTGRATNTSNGSAPDTDTATVTSVFDPTAGICGRTEAVRDAIVALISGVVSCADVTDTQLAAITGTLSLDSKGISALAAGDFDELTALTALDLQNNSLSTLPAGVFDELTALRLLWLLNNSLETLPAGVFDNNTALTALYLNSNSLSTLPAGVFDGLTALTTLSLSNTSLSTLPAGVFDQLTALTDLFLHTNSLSTLPAGVFDQLTALTSLTLGTNSLSTLRAGVFDQLTAVTNLQLHDNSLSTLPAGVFDQLTALTTLRLQDNPGAPFSPTADALPDDGTVPAAGGDVTLDGSGSGGPWGTNVTYSWAAGGAAVTFDDAASATPVVTIPALAAGIELTFTLTVTGRATNASNGSAPDTDIATVTVFDPTAGICGRTEQVRDAIVGEISGAASCADVIDAHLAAITSLGLSSKGITALASGDFDGLTALTRLDLNNNSLSTLPAGVFDELTALDLLFLHQNSLSTLRAGVFDQLTALTRLWLFDNSLSTLRAGVFDQLTALTNLQLHDNSLSTLPAGVFDQLTALTTLRLQNNPGAPFSPTADARPDDGTVLPAGGDVTLDGSGSAGGPWGTNVTYSWAASGAAATFDDAARATPVVTIPALAEGTELTFTLTVTGRATNASNGSAPDTDTATVTAVGVPELSFAPNVVTVNEDAVSATLTVELDPASTGTVTVDYATRDGVGAAKAGEDYTATSGTLTFAATETSKTFTVPILDDDVYENNESFSVDLTNPTGATLVASGATVRIDSEDAVPTASMADVTVDEGAGTMTLTLRLSHPSDAEITYSTSASTVTGTATEGDDYDDFLLGPGRTARITVPAGDLSQTFDITIVDDSVDEPDETIDIGWQKSVNAEAIPINFTFTGTFTDNDTAGVTVSKTALTVTEADTTGDSYTVVLDSQPTANVVVTVAGHAGTEVLPAPTTLTFTSTTWNTPQPVTVTAADDTDTANDEVSLTHSAASTDSNYDAIVIGGVTVTVEDNDTAQVTGVMVAPGNAQLTVGWAAVANATGYEVQWKSGGQSYNTSDRQATVASGSTTSHTLPGLANDTEYTVRVRATRTGANAGPYSDEEMATPKAAGVTVSKTALTVTEADTTGDSYTVVLDSQPTASVVVTVAGHAGTEVLPAPTTLTFTSTTWNTPQPVTVTAADDTDTANDEVTLTHSAASTDSDYDAIVIGGVTVTVEDNDTANSAPTFTSAATFDAAENQTAVGTVVASDGDADDTVTGYAIQGGADRSTFSIVETTGVLTFASAPNFEAPADADTDGDYVVVVRATSGTGDRVKTADQTITVTVTDVAGEAPGVPAAPMVTAAGVTSVTAAWTAPANAGPPITDYDYRYRVTSPQGAWTEVTGTAITALSATITGLAEDTGYDVQVRATTDEGTSGWSGSGSGSTDANAAPMFTSAATFDAAENQTAVGTVAASDGDADDTVTGYAIQGGADRSTFSIVETTGVLTFASAPNFEAPADADTDNAYVVVVRATSGTGDRVKTADQTITVTVTDVAGEAPGVPAAPMVTAASVTSVTAAWTAPANAGPPITDYDYRYRVTSPQGAWTEVTTTAITGLSATITGLVEDTGYDVQVRATTDEGTSGWSGSGSGSTDANAAPAFTSAATFDAAENQTAVGTVVASDGDVDDTVTGYAIQGGADRSTFSIVETSGVLTFASAPNFEAPADADTDNAYVVVVRATSGTGDRVKTADQTITVTVTDVDGEAPGVPAAPMVTAASVTSVTAAWTAPANAGPPITDYDYRYRVTSPQGAWTEVTGTTITALGATITGLAEDTEYDVQVRATTDEGTSGWSGSGSGSTDANAAPAFTSAATFDAAENQTAVGTVAASDGDADDTVTGYAIQGGADRSTFSIVETTGVLTFASAPNFEAPADADTDNAYVVVVRATSGTGDRVKTADQTITVTVTDVDGEAPGVPAAPMVTAASVTSVTAAWTAPANAGPPITDYDYRYRVTSPQGAWTEVTTTAITGLSATITGLVEDTGYDVQVRATTDEGTSGWSGSGSGSTDANAAPAFTSAATFDAAENQTAVGTVVASDGDVDDTVTGYAIQGGADRSTFSIVETSGVLTFASAPNFEAPADADTDNAYVVVVRATSGTGDRVKTADQTITVTVTDVDGEAPGRTGRADGDGGVGDERDGGLDRAGERGPSDHGLRLPLPGDVAAGRVDGGDGHDDHGARRDDHGARGGHRVRRAGAGDHRRGHERLVRLGQRLDGRERGAGVHLGGDVRRGGEPDRGGDGGGLGRRRGRHRDGLRDPGRRGPIDVLDRRDDRGADVRVGAELRGPGGRGHGQRLRGGGAGRRAARATG